MSKFIIQGGHKLSGVVRVSGDKNTALKILPATILCRGDSTIHNVPDIADVRTILGLLEFLGASYTFTNNTVKINTDQLVNKELPLEMVSKMRSSIMFLGPLLARFTEVRIGFPGGCVLGKRSVSAHLDALVDLGAELLESDEALHLQTDRLGGSVTMRELSVTATENALIAAAGSGESCELRMCALEPSVSDLARFLVATGARIEGIETPVLRIQGSKKLKGVEHTIIPDRIEAGTFAAIAGGTGSAIRIEHCQPRHLDAYLNRMRRMGISFVEGEDYLEFSETSPEIRPIENFDTRTYPGFATDLHPPLAVLLTQADGESRIFETLFENRLQYLVELEKMGADTEILNPHMARVRGVTPLRGATVTSHDLRAGAAMVVAGLIAEGTTIVDNIAYIDRGYERLEEKLKALGARIERVI